MKIETKGSLCSGTGALDRATPGELRWVCESAAAPATVLKREHPEVPNFGDLLTTDWSYRQHRVDLLTSGDPCQSMSVSGRRKASGDERFLWPEVMQVIRTVNPLELFLENVHNLINVPLIEGGEKGGVLKLRLDDLRVAGYAVKWAVLGACAVGAPHHRHRWFLRAKYVGAWRAPEAERVIVKCGAPRSGGRLLLPTPTAADGAGGGGRSPKRTGGDNLRTAVQLLPTPLARDGDGRGEGDAKYWEARQRRHAGGLPLGAEVGLLPTPRDVSSRSYRHAMSDAVDTWGKFATAVQLWEEIIGRSAPSPTEQAPKGGRRLNPSLSEWMMGYPQGYLTNGVTRNDALKMAGNGVVELQARTAWELLS